MKLLSETEARLRSRLAEIERDLKQASEYAARLTEEALRIQGKLELLSDLQHEEPEDGNG